MRQKGLNNSRNRYHASNDRAQRRVILQEPNSTFPFRQSNRCDLVLEIHARRRTTEERGLVEQLRVLRDAVLVAVRCTSEKRDVLHRDQFQEVRNVVEICVHVLSVIVESVFAVFCITEGKSRYDVGAIESGEVFTIKKVGMLACNDVKMPTLCGEKRLVSPTWKLPSPYRLRTLWNNYWVEIKS